MRLIQVILAATVALTFASAGNGFAPGPEADDDERDNIRLYDVNEERADRIAAAFTEEDPTCPNYDMRDQIVVPIAENGTLVGYAFMTPRFCFARGVNRFQSDDNMHFVFDGMVRAVHRTPFVYLGDDEFDQSATMSAVLSAAQDIIGEERLERVDLIGFDVRYLR